MVRIKQQFTLSLCLGWLLVGTPLLTVAEMQSAIAQSQTIPADVREAYTLLGKGWVDDAIAAFRQSIQRYPDSIEAKLGLAISFRRAGRDGDAWQAYQRVLQQDPNNPLALKTIGILAGFKPEWQKQGIEALTTLLKLNSTDSEARAQRALLYGYQGRFSEALADYEIVLQANPTPEVLLGAAQIYTYAGDSQKGLELFERYRSRTNTPITGNAAIAYARALRTLGNSTQAIALLEGQLPRQINAFGIQVRSELSQAYLANRQSTQALAVLDPLRDRPDSRLPLARALNELGRQENRPELVAQAGSLYRQVLNETANPSPVLLREIADVLSGIPKERKTALQLYRQLAQQQPENQTLIIQKLALEAQLGTLTESEIRQQLRPILQSIPNEPAQQFAIAQALVRLEPDPEFLPVYERLIRSGVNEPFLNFRLAQLLIEQNEFEAAKEALARYQSTSVGSRDRASELLLAELDRKQGNLESAAKRYEALISDDVSADLKSGAIRSLAGLRLAQNRFDDALKLYDRLIADNPEDLQLLLGRAAVAYQAKKISESEAEMVLARFLQSRPSETPSELYTLVGILPSDSSREPLYNALIEADPTNVPVQVRLIQLLASRDPRQARAQANRLMARIRQTSTDDRSNVSLLFLKAQLEQTLGNSDRAEDAYQAILKVQPENLDALSGLGGVRFQQRQFSSASSLYSQILELDPDNRIALRSLAELSAAQGQPLAALDQFEQLKIQQVEQGTSDPELEQRIQKVQEGMLQQRGFQPPWERY
ncbi:tetratricopeptide repeat protein [Leptolyngbya sp. NIES-2104]|uniref:tetratricopeptide repeat protein n=1 Tax=Leptolyngbya sp. NIES-2104 TaxID=1552121 RepID=UPI0006ECCA53|nr:tetratricopeptide repeat protein [Leptolyngbya sp. NIES-2104]GAP98832.1 TPR domain containing protein [Leptolyngbya sp. NIES-2104]